jgi:CBS domain-containing protein
MDVGRGRLCTVDRRQTVGEVARLMAAERVRAVVIEAEGRAVGIVTDRDLVLRAMAKSVSLDAPVESIMTPDPVTAEADEPIEVAQGLLRHHGLRQVPLTRDGRVVGLVGLDDLVFELNIELRRLLPDFTEARDAP